MSIRPDQLLLPSILDRLISGTQGPKSPGEGRAQLLQQLKESVRRDLQNLLNTRVCLTEIPPDLEELDVSVLNYGIPDFAGVTQESSRSLERLRKRIEEAVRKYETRFKSVNVRLASSTKSRFNRTLQFEIDGVLYAEPSPEPVLFSSQLDRIASEFRVNY